jgi:dTMP kinase
MNGQSKGGCWPDLTVVFDVDDATASTRVSPERDRMEQKDDPYRARVREGYLAQVRDAPDRFALIDASGNVEDVTREMFDAIAIHRAMGVTRDA